MAVIHRGFTDPQKACAGPTGPQLPAVKPAAISATRRTKNHRFCRNPSITNAPRKRTPPRQLVGCQQALYDGFPKPSSVRMSPRRPWKAIVR